MQSLKRSVLGVVAVVAVAACGTLTSPQPPPEPQAVACTHEALVCPNGTTVSRAGPTCEFEACPGDVGYPETLPSGGGLSPDPAPQGPNGGTNPVPMGTMDPPPAEPSTPRSNRS